VLGAALLLHHTHLAAPIAVLVDLDVVDVARRAEDGAEVLLRGVPGEVVHVDATA
jgi:hypothetical protein